ncbi:MAG: hypothetical protein ABWX68_08215 [Arthrobacter sp.]|uniref:hypothetical protein n=1 Tax=Arthrobacter sp. TaxID=1667 RepID=UPI003474C70C
MHDLAASMGPVLDLVGWVGLVGSVVFFVAAAVVRARHGHWVSAPCHTQLLENQECIVWRTPDGSVVSHVLHGAPADGRPPETVYYREANPRRWQTHAPQDGSRALRTTGWALAALFLACQALGLAAAAL